MSSTIVVKSRDSLLTTSSGYTNYRGILNLVIILLVLSNARAALENFIKYGILVDPLLWLNFFHESSKHTPSLLITLGLSGPILISLLVERLIATSLKQQSQKQTTNLLANAVILGNLFACIALPPLVIYTNDTHPISASLTLMLVSIVFLKLLSYHMMNFWCRDLRRPEQEQSRTTRSFLRTYIPPAVDFGAITVHVGQNGSNAASNAVPAAKVSGPAAINKPNGFTPVISELRKRNQATTNNNNANMQDQNTASRPNPQANNSGDHQTSKERQRNQVLAATRDIYPANLTLVDISTFMLFPTLCYELQFARTLRMRKRFLIKRLVELLILSQMDMALIQQWIVPTVSNSVLPFRQMKISYMLERLLKLAIPNHVIWLIWFYMFFHSLLNIVAELTRFADREFYRDWWNSQSVYYFWSNWNIPVHKWCARHLYVPLMALGLTKCQASTSVFLVSAFFHEYLVSVPLKMFRMWAFTGMLVQLPWAKFVSLYFNENFANVAVWGSLIIGQPLCILMYYHDYYVINHLKPVAALN